MHIAFYTDKMDEMIDFYINVLGAKVKLITKLKSQLNREDRPALQELARKNPEGIFNVYLEIGTGQFIELFPAHPNQIDDVEWNKRKRYNHFALLVDDIFETKKELLEKGVEIDIDISIGASKAYQMWIHDPDRNKFEIMQYTDESYQIVGHID